MEDTLLYIIGSLALGQTGMLFTMSRELGNMTALLTALAERVTTLEEKQHEPRPYF